MSSVSITEQVGATAAIPPPVPQQQQQLPIVIGDDFQSKEVFDAKKYIYPSEYEGHFSSCMIESNDIRNVIKLLAKQVSDTLNGRRPVLICTLKGACQFYIHFLDELQLLRQGYDVEFVRASSYEGTSTTGTVQMMGELNVDALQGRHVIIIEDIVDTGTTLATLVPILSELGKPSAVDVVTLLDKRLDDSYKKKFHAKFVGFSIPNHFIIGYGLDYNELYRDVKDIFVISETGISFDRSSLAK